jgi:hypothetical protein
MPPFSRYLGAMHKVAFADDADNFPVIVNDRHGADPLFYKKTGHVLDRCGRFYREHCQSHNVSSYHFLTPHVLSARAQT